jgi:malate/lactate dehydrogenase
MTTVAITGGAGGVGSSLAFNLLMRPEPYDVVVVDRSGLKVASHVMDLEQIPALAGGGSVRPGGLEALEDADVVVMCASTALTDNTSRAVYLDDNAKLVLGMTQLLGPGVLIVVTNPVDALCTLVVQHHGLDRRRVLGYTLNDTLRLRTAVAQARGVASADVEAYVLGEHGDGSVPVFSRVSIHGQPVSLEPGECAAAAHFVRTWYREHVALDPRRSSTWTSGAGVARMIAGLRARADPWPASVVLDGEYGTEGVSVTVPVALGPRGVERIHEWELAADELAGLRRAAEAVRAAARRAGP